MTARPSRKRLAEIRARLTRDTGDWHEWSHLAALQLLAEIDGMTAERDEYRDALEFSAEHLRAADGHFGPRGDECKELPMVMRDKHPSDRLVVYDRGTGEEVARGMRRFVGPLVVRHGGAAVYRVIRIVPKRRVPSPQRDGDGLHTGPPELNDTVAATEETAERELENIVMVCALAGIGKDGQSVFERVNELYMVLARQIDARVAAEMRLAEACEHLRCALREGGQVIGIEWFERALAIVGEEK